MKEKGPVPEKGTSDWKRNEKIINSNQVLKNARDVSEGFKPKGTAGEAQKPISDAYRDGWDRIFGKKNEEDK